MSPLMQKILEESKNLKKIIGIRKYNAGDDLYVGYIVDYSDSLFLMQHITKYGEKDGFIVERLDSIESVETDDDYVNSYQFLVKNTDKIREQSIDSFNLPDEQNWQYEILKVLFEQGDIITVELNNDDLVVHGYIADFDEDFLKLKPIDKLGNPEGFTLYKLSDISGLTIGSQESRKRQAFVEWKANPK